MGGSVIPRSRWCRGPSEWSTASGQASRPREVFVRTLSGKRGRGHRGERADVHGRARRGQQAGPVPFWPRNSSQPIPRAGIGSTRNRMDLGDGPRAPDIARTRRAYVAPWSSTTVTSPVWVDASSARISSLMPAMAVPPGPRGRARRRSARGSGWWRARAHRRRRSVLREAAGPTGSRWRRRRRTTTGRAGSGGVLPRLAARPRCGSRIHGQWRVAPRTASSARRPRGSWRRRPGHGRRRREAVLLPAGEAGQGRGGREART